MRAFAGILIIVCMLLSFIPLNNEIASLTGSYSEALKIIFGIGWTGGIVTTGIYTIKGAF